MVIRVLTKAALVFAACFVLFLPALCPALSAESTSPSPAPPVAPAPALTPAPAPAPTPSTPAPIPSPSSSIVAEVAVTGNQNINVETIRGAITLKPGDEFKEEAAEKDKAAIMSLGCFSAVTLRQETISGGTKVTYEVTENPKVTDIKIEGSGPIPPEKILAVMKTKPGQVLNTTTLDQDILTIQSYYSDEQYLAWITPEVGVDQATGVLTVPIIVSTVESVQIEDNKKTRSYVFLREMKTKPGDYLNVGVLAEDRKRVYNLYILEDIQPPRLDRGSDIGKVKVVWKVVEKKTGQVNLGFGYNSTQRLVGTFSLSETNFRGKGQGLNLSWQQGTTDAVGGRSSYELGFSEPWLDSRHTSLAVTAYNKIVYRFSSGVFSSGTFANDQTYNERHTGGEVTLSRPLTEFTRVFVGGRLENVDTNPALLSTATPEFARIVQRGNVGSGSVRLVHNTRDLEEDPASGRYQVLSAEFGTVDAEMFNPPTSTNTNFTAVPFQGSYTKGTVEYRMYMSRGGRKRALGEKRTTLAFRVRLGLAAGTLPFFEQYFIGGAESLRGYREDRFWGRKSLLASVELRKPIAQAIAGVIFLDYGDAWDPPAQYFIGTMSQSSSFVGFLGVGVGMRVTTPIGNIRLDYGIGAEGGRTHFSMGQAF